MDIKNVALQEYEVQKLREMLENPCSNPKVK